MSLLTAKQPLPDFIEANGTEAAIGLIVTPKITTAVGSSFEIVSIDENSGRAEVIAIGEDGKKERTPQPYLTGMLMVPA